MYITDRKFDAGIYYNLERKWNDTDKCTTRTPDANGLYSFRMAYKGQVVTMQTKSLEVANAIDSQVAFVVALELDENGLITKAVHAKYAEECKGGVTVSYVIVTKIDGDQVTTYKESTGETKTITLATDAQFINVSNLYDSFRGEYTQLRLGDKIHCLAEKGGKTNYLFITSRKQVVVDHACPLNDADTVWYEWNGNTGFTENGYYILTKDVNRSKRITIKEGQEITLCLNGHTLTCEDRVFSIYGKLTICDHKHADGSYAGKIISNYSNTVDDQGNITGKVYGGIAYLYNETQDVELNIYGGNLVHKGTATAAGLIYVANMADSGFRAVLNLYDGVLSGGNVTESGGAVAVRNAGTFNMYGGKITGCKATTGAGVHAQSSQAVFRMEGGVIENCHSTDVGAGVCIGNGTAYMTGGEITGCTTTGNGGSVNITVGSFTMTGGSVEKGKAKEGGNLRVGTAATFTLGGNAIISGGEATNGGNAVVYGTLILQDQAVIKDGVASNKGGNINAFANLEEATANILMTGGKISGGVAAVDSGSIRLDANEGTVNMTVTGGTIEAGEAPYAPCVKVGAAEKIHLTVGGNVRIDQVHLESGKYMTIHEAGLENTSSIGVTVANGNKPFVTILDPEDVNCFHSCAQDESQLVNENNGLYLKILHSHCQCGGNLTGEALNAHQCQSAQDFTAVDWTNFKDGGIFEKPGNYLNFVESGYYYLTSDVATGYVIEIKEGQQITLCLNGHTLRSDAGSSSAIRLKGELNICDCHGGGKITGKSTKAPGLVYLLTSESGTVFNLYGGDLVMTDEDYTANAGVIQVANNANYPVVFNMYGGTISGGTANKGGNVLIGSASGTMNMYGGAITGGAVQNNDGTEDRNRGGNIYVNGGTLNVYGGIISGGTADAQAVTPALGGDIFQKGGKVYLNTGFETLDYANDGVGYLTLGESFTANKVTCKTLAESAKIAEGTEEQAKVFEVSQADYEKRYENGAITMTQVALLYHSHCQCGGNLTGEALNAHQCQSAQDFTAVDWTNFKDGGIFEKPGNYLNFVESGYYYLTSDVATGYVIEIKEGQQITLCLNGHTLRSDAGSSSAIRLKGELNICDCHGGGKITGKSTKAPGLVYLLTSESGTVFNLYGGDLVMTDEDYTANAGVIQVANNANYPVVFNMYGGTISGGTANKGGNVLIGSASGTMNMYGGAITGGAVQNNDGTEDRNRGGNIYVNGGTLNVYGGIISGGTADAQAVTPALGGDIFQKGGKVYLNTGFETLDYANDGVGYLTLGESFTANKVTCKTLAESAKIAEGTEEQAKVFEVSQADYEKRYENGAITMTQVALLYHRHCQCGGNLDSQVQSFHQADCQVVADWTAINQENFVVGELLVAAQTNGRVNFAENGCYYLEENVSTSSVLELLKDADITLCLNGYTLTSTATGNSAIRLSGKLNICDCQGGGVITGKSTKSAGLIFMLTSGADAEQGTTLNLYGGTLTVTDKNYTQNAGVLQVGNSGNNPGVFNMYGGTISGGAANKGGNILIGTAAATMNLYGGSVVDGSVKTNDTSTDRNRGGNIYVYKGTLNVYGGIISGGMTTADDPNPGLGGDIYLAGGKVQFYVPMDDLDIANDGTGELILAETGSDREDP